MRMIKIKKIFLFFVFACLIFLPPKVNAKESVFDSFDKIKTIPRDTLYFYKPLISDILYVHQLIGKDITTFLDGIVFNSRDFDVTFNKVGESWLFAINHTAKYLDSLGNSMLAFYVENGKSLNYFLETINKPTDELASAIVAVTVEDISINTNKSRNDLIGSPISFWDSLISKISDPLVPLFLEKNTKNKSDHVILENTENNSKDIEKEDTQKNTDITTDTGAPQNLDSVVRNYYTLNPDIDQKLLDMRLEFLGLNQNLLNYVEKKRILQAERIGDSNSKSISDSVKNISGSTISNSSASLTTLSVAGDFSLAGGFFDSNSSEGVDGYILQSTGTGTEWVATSSLGISGGGASAIEDLTDVSSMTESYGDVLYWNGTSWGNIATSSLGIITSPWTTSGLNIYYNTGNVGIGTTTPGQKLSVAGDILGNNIIGSYFTATSTATSTFTGGLSTKLLNVTSTTASSTFANGLNLTSGCFAINGTCLISGGSISWGSITGSLSNQTDLTAILDGKQEVLVSSTNIKTINGNSLLGGGDLTISGGGLSSFSSPLSTMNIGGTLTDPTIDINFSQVTLSDFTNDAGFLTSIGGLNISSLNNDSGYLTSIGGLNISSLTNDTGYITSVSGGNHNLLSNLTTGDVHTQYAYLSGRSGGQTFIGGTASGNSLTLKSTSHATKGKIIFGNTGTTAYDEVNERFGIGTASPSTKMNIYGNVGSDIMARVQNANSTGRAVWQTYNDVGSVWEFSSMGSIYSGSIFGNTRAGKIELIGNADAMIGTVSNNFMLLGTNNVEVMRLTTGGNVGIGTTTPGQKLSVAGNILGNNIIGSYFTATSSSSGFQATNLLGGATNLTVDANGNIIRDPSDRNLKENIETIDRALEKVLKLRGVSYEWKDKERFGNQKEIGVIAQEVEDVVPEVVSSGGEYKSVNIKNLVGLLIEAIKELAVKVDSTFSWFKGDRLNIKNDVCVDDVCITKDQFKSLLLQAEGNTNISGGNSNSNSDSDSSVNTDEDVENDEEGDSNVEQTDQEINIESTEDLGEVSETENNSSTEEEGVEDTNENLELSDEENSEIESDLESVNNVESSGESSN